MLCANVAAARFFDRHPLPVLYRVHEGPSEEKLENLRAFLGELGLGLRGGVSPTPEDYQRLLEASSSRDDAHIVQTMMLRSLSQAVYQSENLGHFGLNYSEYAHFTSPIRRYPDLLVHRAIRSVIRSGTRSKLVQRVRGATRLELKDIYPYDQAAIDAFGARCSMSERRADDATREVNAWLKCEYLREHVGEEFDGVVSAVTNFGLFVELDDLYIEGLVHITALPGDYYRFDHAQQRLVGERTGQSFQLGAPLRVLVAAVNLDDRKIDLEPVSLPASRGRKSGKSGADRGRGAERKGGDDRKDDGKDKRSDNRGKARRGGRGRGGAGKTTAKAGNPDSRGKSPGQKSGAAERDKAAATGAGKSSGRKSPAAGGKAGGGKSDGGGQGDGSGSGRSRRSRRKRSSQD